MKQGQPLTPRLFRLSSCSSGWLFLDCPACIWSLWPRSWSNEAANLSSCQKRRKDKRVAHTGVCCFMHSRKHGLLGCSRSVSALDDATSRATPMTHLLCAAAACSVRWLGSCRVVLQRLTWCHKDQVCLRIANNQLVRSGPREKVGIMEISYLAAFRGDRINDIP